MDTNLVEVSSVPGGKASDFGLSLLGDSISGDVKFVLNLSSAMIWLILALCL